MSHNIPLYATILEHNLTAGYAPYQLRLATYFQQVLHDSSIITGVKILPMGITACIVGAITQASPLVIQKPRFSVPIASALCFASGMLLAYSGGGHGKDYWRCKSSLPTRLSLTSVIFPSQLIGTVGAMMIFVVMKCVPFFSPAYTQHEPYPDFPARVCRCRRLLRPGPLPDWRGCGECRPGRFPGDWEERSCSCGLDGVAQ